MPADVFKKISLVNSNSNQIMNYPFKGPFLIKVNDAPCAHQTAKEELVQSGNIQYIRIYLVIWNEGDLFSLTLCIIEKRQSRLP